MIIHTRCRQWWWAVGLALLLLAATPVRAQDAEPLEVPWRGADPVGEPAYVPADTPFFVSFTTYHAACTDEATGEPIEPEFPFDRHQMLLDGEAQQQEGTILPCPTDPGPGDFTQVLIHYPFPEGLPAGLYELREIWTAPDDPDAPWVEVMMLEAYVPSDGDGADGEEPVVEPTPTADGVVRAERVETGAGGAAAARLTPAVLLAAAVLLVAVPLGARRWVARR